MKAVVLAAFALSIPAAALAEGRALIVGNSTYARTIDAAGAGRAVQAAETLRRLGFSVVSSRDLDTAGLRQALSRLSASAEGAGRLAILLEGHFVHSGRASWFLGTEATGPDLATVGAMGVNLDTVLEIAGQAPGGALVLLGGDDSPLALGAGLAGGLGPLDIPQGVTVISGPIGPVADFASGDLGQPGQSLAALAAAHPELSAEGFLAPMVPFVPAPGTGEAVAADTAAEAAAWQAAQASDTAEAVQAFLSDYPAGAHAEDARKLLAQMLSDPHRAERKTEEGLNLSRDQRAQIQRALSILDHDPNGIDGIFGPGTRAAIRDWQLAQGTTATGYLDAGQIARLNAQATRRAKQLQAEAEARRAAEERQDKAYWAQTGAKGDEAGLRSYLDRYPDGTYADVAQARLDKIEAGKHAAAARQDRAAWDRAASKDTVAAYRTYLRAFPKGAFADAAHARIRRLTQQQQNDAAERKAQAAEAALGLTPFSRRLVESRLAALNLDPGKVDGVFNLKTRRAIRRFQRANDLPVTGYLTQVALVRLLASAGN
ncbi:peptidoglycan-binding protein [Acidimangrovimonas pyrenivorans]|uniref:Peptidoglycan-binding protein n=1 Tax=Acidimangrovimonas pyrenivorans TaxID=2030798 RepID=A0ABV7ACM1_9RHOB